jgi:hypothetical protein
MKGVKFLFWVEEGNGVKILNSGIVERGRNRGHEEKRLAYTRCSKIGIYN